jgi:hypothetical protein
MHIQKTNPSVPPPTIKYRVGIPSPLTVTSCTVIFETVTPSGSFSLNTGSAATAAEMLSVVTLAAIMSVALAAAAAAVGCTSTRMLKMTRTFDVNNRLRASVVYSSTESTVTVLRSTCAISAMTPIMESAIDMKSSSERGMTVNALTVKSMGGLGVATTEGGGGGGAGGGAGAGAGVGAGDVVAAFVAFVVFVAALGVGVVVALRMGVVAVSGSGVVVWI